MYRRTMLGMVLRAIRVACWAHLEREGTKDEVRGPARQAGGVDVSRGYDVLSVGRGISLPRSWSITSYNCFHDENTKIMK